MNSGSALYFLVVAALAFGVPSAGAQQSVKVPRIGVLGFSGPRALFFESFRQGLRELGYVEGQNIILETRPSKRDEMERNNRLHEHAVELVRRKVDVIVALNAAYLHAARIVTKTIPIVMTFVGDAASEGFVASLERPGGNVTGVSGLKTELGGKWFELIKETVPSAKRVAVFWNPRSEDNFPTWRGVEVSARALGVDLNWVEVRHRDQIARVFKPGVLGRADAMIVLPGGVFFSGMQEIVDGALKNSLPGISWRTDFAERGGLMSYGADRLEQSRRAAYVVDKILKGARPAELPMELPKSFELVINLKTAKDIGITIPHRVLAWADRVIR